MLLDIIMGILGFGFSLIAMIFRVVLAIAVGIIAAFKRRNGLLWGAATLFFPWIFFIILFMPKKYPKFSSRLTHDEAFKGKNPVVASIMALAAMVAKSDGAISKEEISLVKKFVSSHFGIYGDELDSYAEAFNYGKNHPEAYSEFTRVLAEFYTRREILAIAYLFVTLAMQGEGISDNEDQFIRKILGELGITEYEYISIKNSFNYRSNYSNDYSQYSSGYGYYQGNQGSHFGAANQQSLVAKYYNVLGVQETDDMNTIKKAYRKLVKEYHPDKLASESMPEEYKAFAEQKIVEINEAYEYLKKIKEN